ncbi:uncharacterized protein LOC127262115 [Andrographis paniculata]|uniref:uncharacterized protein LOC127262115 n=1 Tax=Andrographis paniculata TaxID=175694 RepID=UPI0021E97EE5|nr:uncharacterized protein LOC127262115 [Andrographis paniculata]
MEAPSSAVAPLLLRNLLITALIYAEKPLVYLYHRSKFLELIRHFLISLLLFFLNLLPSLFSSFTASPEFQSYSLNPASDDNSSGAAAAGRGEGGSGVSRALSQLLLLMNEIPVSSRKYELVRSLIEKLLHENLAEDSPPLTAVNCAVLSAAFSRTLSQLQFAVAEHFSSGAESAALLRESGPRRLLKGVSSFWRAAVPGSEMSRFANSGDKLSMELLWLAQKMAASGCAEEAVLGWASASKLARLALSAEPRLQGSIVKVSAFLIGQAKDIGKEPEDGAIRETNMKMLVSWLPLLCRAHNGIDAPILSVAERAELEKTLEEMISSLEEDEQEVVLSQWLHHFTCSPASDWPNLRTCYTQWYNASRSRLLAASTPASRRILC